MKKVRGGFVGLFDIFHPKKQISNAELNFKDNINNSKKLKDLPNFTDVIVLTTQTVALDFLNNKKPGPTIIPCENILLKISNDILLFETSAWFISFTNWFLKNSPLVPNDFRSDAAEHLKKAAGKIGEIFETVGNFKDGKNLFKNRYFSYPPDHAGSIYLLKIILQEIGLEEPVSVIGEIPLKLLLSDSHYDLEQRCMIYYTTMFDGGFQAITNCIPHAMKESQDESINGKTFDREEVESPALKEFEKELSGWPPEQVKIALLLIKDVFEGRIKDVNDIDSKLTFGHLKSTMEVVKKMYEEDKKRNKSKVNLL